MLAPMDWKTLIAELSSAGLTQGLIADRLGIRQPSVSDIASGRTKNPSWAVGEGLRRLHRKHCKRSRKAAAQ